MKNYKLNKLMVYNLIILLLITLLPISTKNIMAEAYSYEINTTSVNLGDVPQGSNPNKYISETITIKNNSGDAYKLIAFSINDNFSATMTAWPENYFNDYLVNNGDSFSFYISPKQSAPKGTYTNEKISLFIFDKSSNVTVGSYFNPNSAKAIITINISCNITDPQEKPADLYNTEVNVERIDFGKKTKGYNSSSLSREITIKNTSSEEFALFFPLTDTENFGADLETNFPEGYSWNPGQYMLKPGQTFITHAYPKEGLGPGTYNDTIKFHIAETETDLFTGNYGKTIEIPVTFVVEDESQAIVDVTNISLNKTSLTLNKGTSETLKATVSPSNATDKSITWTSSNNNVATVDQNGNVVAKNSGNATITVTSKANSNIKATCNITVKNDVVSISLPSEVSVPLEGDKVKLEVTFNPSDADNKNITFTSDDESIVKVDNNGYLTPIKEGVTTVRATSHNGKQAITIVTVTSEYYTISFDANGGSGTMDKITAPKGQSVSIPECSFVAPNGKVFDKWIINPGDLEFSSNNISYSGNSDVTFVAQWKDIIHVSKVELDKEILNLNKGSSDILRATVSPNNASDKSVTWKSSNNNVATVDQYGIVTAKGNGEATITVTTKDGNKTDTCKVIVKTPVVSISAEESLTLNLDTNEKKNVNASVSPSDASDNKITYTSSNPEIATVDSNGLVTPLKKGYTIITSKVSDTLSTSTLVEVTSGYYNVSFDANGGSGTMETVKVPLDQSFTVPSCSFKAPSGKVFYAWKLGNGELPAGASLSSDIDITLVAQYKDIVHVSKVELNKEKLNLNKGSSEKLRATVTPSDATDKSVTWKSSNTNIATVDSNGVVTAKANGTAKITVTTKDGSKTDSCDVVVTTAVTSISAEKDLTLNLDTNEKKNVNASVLPNDASDKTITYSSSNPSVATVDSNGLVTPHKKGIALITSRSSNGETARTTVTVETDYYNVSFDANGGSGTMETVKVPLGQSFTVPSCSFKAPSGKIFDVWKFGDKEFRAGSSAYATGDITLVAQYKDIVHVSGVSLNKSNTTINEGATETLRATVSPSDASDKSVTWKSSNVNVATVDQNGKVTAKANGEVTITVTTKDGNKSATCKVKVITQVTSITVEGSLTLNLDTNEKKNVNASVSPSDASDKKITYTSSNPSVATVDSNGLVTPLKSGTTNITSQSSNKDVKETTKVTVTSDYYVISFNAGEGSGAMDALKVKKGEYIKLPNSSFVAPNGKTFDKWKTSSGTYGAGISLIFYADTTLTAIYKDIVHVNDVELNKDKLNLNKDSSETLRATVSPSDATDKSVTWKSSDESIATVDANGKVTAKKNGTAKITVTTNDGKKTDICDVVVTTAVSSITAENSLTLNLDINEKKNVNASVLPNDASNKTITYSSSNTSVATVDSKGLVTPLKSGSATITSKSSSGKTTTTKVTVTSNYYYVSFNPGEGTGSMNKLKVEKDKFFDVPNSTFTPPAGKAFDVWQERSSTYSPGASVKYTGDVEFTAKYKDIIRVNDVELDEDELSLSKGSSKTLKATVSPSEATDKSVTWKSSDDKVATVDQNGKVTAKGNGTAKITVTTNDGKKTDTCDVVVKTEVTSITAEGSLTLNLDKNEKKNVKATVTPSDASNKTITYSSSNTSVATVDSNGLVTPHKKGSATITSKSSNGKIARTTVTVETDYYRVSFDANGGSGTMETIKVPNKDSFTVPSSSFTAPEGKIFDNWKSSIKDTVLNPGNSYWASGDSTLIAQWKDKIDVTSVALDKKNVELNVPNSVSLKATVSPSDASDKSVTWKSSDTSVATVDKYGKVTAKAPGTATITVTTNDGKKVASANVTVKPSSADYYYVSFNANGGTGSMNDLKVKKDAFFTVPECNFKAPNGKSFAYWSVGGKTYNPGDSIKYSGNVTFKANWVNRVAVKSITLDKKEVELSSNSSKNNSVKLNATISPDNATNKGVIWSSSNEKVATVDQNGRVTAKANGNAVITAKTKDGAKEAKCNVVVTTQATEIKMKERITLNLDTNEKTNLNVEVIPSNASDKSVAYEVKDESIISVDSKGNITPLKAGTTYVYARMGNGVEKNATVTVTSDYYVVNFLPNGGHGKMDSMKVKKGEYFTVPECKFVGPNGASFVTWKNDDSDHDFNPGNSASLLVGDEFDLVAKWSEDTKPTPTPTPTPAPSPSPTLDKCEINPSVAWERKDGKDYWYEKVGNSFIKQGIYGSNGNVWYDNTERGREIYDPCSNAWYWLDAKYEGAKAVNKEVFMPYIYSNEDSFTREERINVSSLSDTYTESNFTADMSNQVLDAINNKTGKWVRYDSEGRMIKGWYTVSSELDKSLYPDQVGNTYYYDYQTGLMAKGLTRINGVNYYFDPITGVLQ